MVALERKSPSYVQSFRVALFVVVISGLVSGCMDDESISLSPASIESRIANSLDLSAGGITIQAKPTVSCPSPMTGQVGDSWTCKARLSGLVIDVKVTLQDESGRVGLRVVNR